ncbi:hypothetical protein [Clostridium beijerinckii]|uniref:hypothetical protein n=1 Tax=Clostridium beijerinckii TaxID=1520 RepID=UPI001570867E|nr:hypothetical protein [Clostridium beijerinckii]NRU52514.1 hypothetical protein [Clostridium beijerinckii]NYC69393.1 hypothetical protein [Clostridium beijerinckii]NYC91715.1 hypothetical protein [Clostridium beijerinckii]
MKDFKFSYARKMKKKLFITAIKGKIEVSIELNIIDNKHSINWINDTSTGHDNFINTLGIAEDQELVNKALEYAKGLKQYKEIIKKYSI